MAHAAFHFAVGLAIGTLAASPGVIRAWRRREPMAAPLGRWVAVSYGLGCIAVFPAILRHAGLPESFTDGWWMNVFLFHPLLSRLKSGGMLIGQLAILGCFGLHYSAVLAAILRLRHTRRTVPSVSPTGQEAAKRYSR